MSVLCNCHMAYKITTCCECLTLRFETTHWVQKVPLFPFSGRSKETHEKHFHCALQRHTPQRKVHAHGPLQRSKFRSQHGNSRDLKILNKYPKTRKNCAEIDPALYVLTFSAKKAPNIGLDRPSSLCFDGIFCTCSSLCTYQGLARFRFRSRSRACVSTHELDLSLKETPKRTPKRDTSTGPLAKFWSGAKVRNAGRS